MYLEMSDYMLEERPVTVVTWRISTSRFCRPSQVELSVTEILMRQREDESQADTSGGLGVPT